MEAFRGAKRAGNPRAEAEAPMTTTVGIVGAGPAGFYVAQELLRRHPTVRVDLMDRLPIPYGLVRYGVAPDHVEVKSKALWFRAILQHPRLRFLGNVDIGRDLSVPELRDAYRAVVFAHGTPASRTLDIPGEQLPGSIAAADFVSWYNGHPEAKSMASVLGHPTVVVVGMGNVALDVCRILLKDPAELSRTDLAQSALDAISKARVRDIHILGRRGPSQAGFTPKELVELSEVPEVSFIVDPAELQADIPPVQTTDPIESCRTRRNGELFEAWARAGRRRTGRRVHFHFMTVPTEVLGEGHVEAVRLARTRLTRTTAGGVRCEVNADPCTELKAGLLVRSIGYRGRALEGLPFLERTGTVPNRAGRVVDSERVVPGCFVCGWLRRGPRGVIGTNKVDAVEVVQNLLDDLPSLRETRPSGTDVAALLLERGVQVVGAQSCHQLERAERYLGALRGRRAEKWTDTADALRFVKEVEGVQASEAFVAAIRRRLT